MFTFYSFHFICLLDSTVVLFMDDLGLKSKKKFVLTSTLLPPSLSNSKIFYGFVIDLKRSNENITVRAFTKHSTWKIKCSSFQKLTIYNTGCVILTNNNINRAKFLFDVFNHHGNGFRYYGYILKQRENVPKKQDKQDKLNWFFFSIFNHKVWHPRKAIVTKWGAQHKIHSPKQSLMINLFTIKLILFL